MTSALAKLKQLGYRRVLPVAAICLLPICAVTSAATGNPFGLYAASVLVPVYLLASGTFVLLRKLSNHERGFHDKDTLIDTLQKGLVDPAKHHSTACVMLEIDNYAKMQQKYGPSACTIVVHSLVERLDALLRRDDIICRISDHQFAIALPHVRRPELGPILSLISRLQDGSGETVELDGTTVHVTLSAGFCLESQVPARLGTTLLDCAQKALKEASLYAPAGVRGYSASTSKSAGQTDGPAQEFLDAISRGEIVAWFQPQVSTDTGEVAGFEALARWEHPQHGTIPPGDFLPALEAAGRLEDLSEVMLNLSLKALKSWDKAGFNVPTVSVNFATQELRNPSLVERIKWDMDRFDLAPNRLTVEILETVISEAADDIITRNIRALSAQGFNIDLDDFGTGHASLANIRRFKVDRIKIDRSFVSHVDDDPEQQRMISAVVALADQLGISTLAEGVETVGEKSILAQLGCTNLQGFSVARPMPVEQTLTWLQEHRETLPSPKNLSRKAG